MTAVTRMVLIGLACAGCYHPPQVLLPPADPPPLGEGGPPQACEAAVREVIEARRGHRLAHEALGQAELDHGSQTASLQARLRDDALDPGGSTRVGLR